MAWAQSSEPEQGLRLSPSQDLGSRATSDYISTGASPISIRSTPTPPSNPIRIDAGTRLQINSNSNGGPDNYSGSGNDSSFLRQNSAFEENLALNNRSRTEFQQLIFKTRGKDIEHFGLSLFGAPPSSYALVDRITPPADYVVAPGDEIRVRAWGQIDVDFTSKVERSGVLYVPLVGGIQVAGTRFSELKSLIRNRLARQYKGFELEVSFEQINMLQVFVTGRAAKRRVYFQ